MKHSFVHTHGRGGGHLVTVLLLLLLVVRSRATEDEFESFGISRELLQSSPTFAYTNIRYESSTPIEHYDKFGGGTDPFVPGAPPPSNEGGGVPILDRASTSPENPFVNEAASSASTDLTEFSKEDLEKRKDMLLAMLEQTNSDLAEIPPSPAPPSEEEEDVPLISTFQTRSARAPAVEYLPQKSVPDRESLLKALEKRVMGNTENESPQVTTLDTKPHVTDLGKAPPASSGVMAWNKNAILIAAAFISVLFTM
ncbi:hypothetical protein PSENEW3_00000475 [Picochlorum sp. SENEW3]|nr:hypothetical protein PSENEW3_00000475 [Picochlorum sp. SENEW3]